MKKLFLGLITILLIAGCIAPGFEFPNPFAPEGPKVIESPYDVISIANITVLPSSSLFPEDQFSVYFEVSNQDEFEPVNVGYNLYDTGLCTILEGGEPRISSSSRSGQYSPNFSPEETRLVEWNFKAPSASDIVSISVTCPIRFKFNFTDSATSQIDVDVIDSGHLSDLQRAGKSPTFTPTVNVGRGPVKIYFDFGTSLPVRNNSALPVYLTVEDKGTGLLREIEKSKFKITFPPNFTVPDNACPYFTCSNDTNGGRKCESNAAIPIISKKSLQIRCSTTTPTPIDTEKTYFINASVDYDYAAVGEVNVEVKP
jgi:hypothetical protein